MTPRNDITEKNVAKALKSRAREYNLFRFWKEKSRRVYKCLIKVWFEKDADKRILIMAKIDPWAEDKFTNNFNNHAVIAKFNELEDAKQMFDVIDSSISDFYKKIIETADQLTDYEYHNLLWKGQGQTLRKLSQGPDSVKYYLHFTGAMSDTEYNIAQMEQLKGEAKEQMKRRTIDTILEQMNAGDDYEKVKKDCETLMRLVNET